VKKFIVLSLGTTCAFFVAAANAQPSNQFLAQSQYGMMPSHNQPTRTSAPRDFVAPPQKAWAPPVQHEWYAGASFVQNFASFTENHSISGTAVADTVNHSAASQMGFAAFLGRRLGDHWRAEMEIGYLSEYSHKDCDDGVCFTLGLSAPYALVSATYNTIEQNWGWLYAGAGIGVAMPEARVDGFDNIKGTSTHFSVMPALMLGYRARIADTWYADLGYRFSAYDAGKVSYDFDDSGTPRTFTNDIGWVLNHSLRIGLAYEF